jgi:hypothetical protein
MYRYIFKQIGVRLGADEHTELSMLLRALTAQAPEIIETHHTNPNWQNRSTNTKGG